MGFILLHAVFVGQHLDQKNVEFGGLLEFVAMQRQLLSQVKKSGFNLMIAELFELNKLSPLLFPHPDFFMGTPHK